MNESYAAPKYGYAGFYCPCLISTIQGVPYFLRANEKLTSIQRARESELTKLHAMQRKAEMRLVTLERTIEEKARENSELTAICDELIAKVGKW